MYMKRFILGVGVILFAVLGVGLADSNSQAQSVNNFLVKAFEADYHLDKDREGRSTLKTVEKITAVFPNTNQNHGLERAIPKSYDGHSTRLQIESVTDENGKELPFSDRTSNGNLVLRIGDADTYVHGEQRYIITYTQRDVTRFFSNSNADEFYWDINGTQWPQSIGQVTARVHIGSSIAERLNGKASCYTGLEGSTDSCMVRRTDADGVLFSAAITDVGAYENMTMAIGFEPASFAPYEQSKLLTLWLISLMFTSLAGMVIVILLIIRFLAIMRRAKGKNGIVVAEYLPPKMTSVLQSAQVIKNSTSDITAQLIDFAVRHYIKIYQTKNKTWLKPAEYKLEIIKDIADLSKEERRLLADLFGKSNLKIGATFAINKLQNNTDLAKKLIASRAWLRLQVRGMYALFERAEQEAKGFRKFGFIFLVVGIITVSPLLIIAAILAFIFSATTWPLTQKGAELRDYLRGLKKYITVAEVERIKMLQSPEGAEKVGVKIGDDPAQLVKLYERVLPYAVLFGIEKEWTKQLGAYYDSANVQPDWYSGNTAFNAALFTSSFSDFSSQSSSYSSSTSSSSGGSDGGGSSGGGGGGGGGGGW